MPMVAGREFPYTRKGMMMAMAYSKKMGQPIKFKKYSHTTYTKRDTPASAGRSMGVAIGKGLGNLVRLQKKKVTIFKGF